MISTPIGNRPRDELFHVISEKERELEQIRRIAERSSEEENRSLRQQLHEVQLNLDHNTKLLLEKEGAIESLQKQGLALRDEHKREITNLEHELKTQFEEEINKTRENCEDETSFFFQRHKDEVRSCLEKEYKSKLLNMERDVTNKFDSALTRKLNEQEEDLRDDFRRILNEKKRQGEDFQSRIEKEKLSIIRKCESEWEDRESMLLEELHRSHENNYQEKTDDVLERMERDRLRYEAGMKDLVEERNYLLKERKHFEKSMIGMQCENRELNEKIQESIGVILEMETEYGTNLMEFTEEIKMRKNEVKKQCDLIENLKSEIPKRNRRHEEERASMKDKHSEEKKYLQNDLKSVHEKLEEYKSLSKLMDKKTQKEIRKLKDYKVKAEDRLTSKTREIKRLKDKVDGYESCLCLSQRNHAEDMMQIGSNKKTHEKLMNELQDGFEVETGHLREELRKKNTEIGMLKIKREKSLLHTTEMEKMLSVASKTSLEKESALVAELDESRNETLDLRRTVALMRNEMESMIDQNVNSQPIALSNEDKSDQKPCGNQLEQSISEKLAQEVHNSLNGFKESVESLKKDLKSSDAQIVSREYNSKDQTAIIRELEDKMSEQFNTIQSLIEDKKSLMDISNKLRSEMMRMKGHSTPPINQRDEVFQSLPNESIQNTSDNSDSDIEGFAKTLLTNVIGQTGTSTKTTAKRASDRETKSQLLSLKKMQRTQRQKNNSQSFTKEKKIRNWNIKDNNHNFIVS